MGNKMDIEYKADMEEDETWPDQVKSVVKDIKDLDSLLPALEEKLADCKEAKTVFEGKVKTMKDMAKELFSATASSAEESGTSTGFPEASSTSTTTTEVKPIAATMIRKKRKPEDEVVAEEGSAKKSRTEAAENGAETPAEA